MGSAGNVGRVRQPVLPLLPADARPVGASAGLVEGPDGGVVVVFGLATFGYAAGDDLGRRLAAVQLAATKVAAAAEVAAAFGVSGVTLWRWGQDFTRGGVARLVRDRTGPKGPVKLTGELAARIAALDGQGLSLRAIADRTGVSTATVRVALGRITPRPRATASTEPAGPDIDDVDVDVDVDVADVDGADVESAGLEVGRA